MSCMARQRFTQLQPTKAIVCNHGYTCAVWLRCGCVFVCVHELYNKLVITQATLVATCRLHGSDVSPQATATRGIWAGAITIT